MGITLTSLVKEHRAADLVFYRIVPNRALASCSGFFLRCSNDRLALRPIRLLVDDFCLGNAPSRFPLAISASWAGNSREGGSGRTMLELLSRAIVNGLIVENRVELILLLTLLGPQV